MTLRWSRFNRFVPSERHGLLLYNSLSSTLVVLEPTLERVLRTIREAPDSYDFTRSPGLFLQLRLTKILVDEEEEKELLQAIRFQKLAENQDLSRLSLMIAPTLGCNFDCSYCYEKSRRPVHMDRRVEKGIATFVRSFPSVRALDLCWYGGEPLIRFKTIVGLTDRLKALGIPLTAQLVTNGYLLNETVIEALETLQIRSIQVTVDGDRETHDTRRTHVSRGATYDTILSNLDGLIRRWDGKLDIRVNIDRGNMDEFGRVKAALSRRYEGGDVTVYPGIVDHGVLRHPDSTCSFTKQEEVDFLYRSSKEGETGAQGFYPIRNPGCMAQKANSFLIGPEGELYKCTHDLGEPDMVVGSIFEGGGWNPRLLARYMMEASPFDDAVCKECFFLPVCDGGCPHFRLERISSGRDLVTCPIFKDRLKESLEITLDEAAQKETVPPISP